MIRYDRLTCFNLPISASNEPSRSRSRSSTFSNSATRSPSLPLFSSSLSSSASWAARATSVSLLAVSSSPRTFSRAASVSAVFLAATSAASTLSSSAFFSSSSRAISVRPSSRRDASDLADASTALRRVISACRSVRSARRLETVSCRLARLLLERREPSTDAPVCSLDVEGCSSATGSASLCDSLPLASAVA